MEVRRKDITAPFACLLFGAVAVLFGCASERERAAFQELRRAEAASYDPRPELPAIDEHSGLPEYLIYASLNNPALEAAFNRWKAALEKVPQARALPDPRFSFTHFFVANITADGPMFSDVVLSQEFPWLSKLSLRRDVALESARAEQRRFDAARLKLFYEVKSAYYEYYYWQRSMATVAETLVLASNAEQVARKKFESGRASNADVVRAQVELGKLDNELRSVRDLQKPTITRLNAVLNRPRNSPLPIPQAIVAEKAQFEDDDQLFDLLRENNPELAALRAEVASQNAAVDLARKNYLPDITLSGDAMGTSQEAPNTFYTATIMLTIPVWHEKNAASVREARACRVDALKQQYDSENSLASQLQVALYNFRNAERKIDLYQATLVPKARQSLSVSRQAFEAGQASFLELVDAQRTLLEFQLAYERALADREQRLAEIEMLVGTQPPRPEPAQHTGGTEP